MNHKFFGINLGLCLFMIVCFSQNNEVTLHDIKMEVYWEKEYQVGGEIVVKVILSNATDHTREFYTRKIQSRDWRIFLTDEKGDIPEMTEYMKNLDKNPMRGVHGSRWHPGYSKEYIHKINKYYNLTKPGRYLATIARRVKFAEGSPHYDERDSVVIRDIPIIVVSDKEPEKQVPEKQENAVPPSNEKPEKIEKMEEPVEEAFPWYLIVIGGAVILGAVALIVIKRGRK